MHFDSRPRGPLLALALTCVIAGAAHADVVYQQDFNTVGGFFSDPNQRLADRFSIAAGATFQEVRWWGNNFGGGPFASFTVSFYADTGNGPGALIASEIVTPTLANTGATDGWGDILEFTADITPFHAAAGTGYYFSTVESVTNHFTWSRTNGTADVWASFNQGPWIIPDPPRVSTAYALLTSTHAVSEPNGALLAGLALSALGLGRLRSGCRGSARD